MALPKPSLGATPAANVARIGDAFDVVDGLVAALADEQAARVAGLAAEGRARDARSPAPSRPRASGEAAVVAEGGRGAAIAREQQDRTAAVVAEGRARAAATRPLRR